MSFPDRLSPSARVTDPSQHALSTISEDNDNRLPLPKNRQVPIYSVEPRTRSINVNKQFAHFYAEYDVENRLHRTPSHVRCQLDQFDGMFTAPGIAALRDTHDASEYAATCVANLANKQ